MHIALFIHLHYIVTFITGFSRNSHISYFQSFPTPSPLYVHTRGVQKVGIPMGPLGPMGIPLEWE